MVLHDFCFLHPCLRRENRSGTLLFDPGIRNSGIPYYDSITHRHTDSECKPNTRHEKEK